MKDQISRTRVRVGPGLRVFAVVGLVGVCALPWSDSRATTQPASIDFYAVTAGSANQHNSCFRLSGTVGQAAPGYSSGGGIALVAGFWSAAPTTGLDEIFFNGFEDC